MAEEEVAVDNGGHPALGIAEVTAGRVSQIRGGGVADGAVMAAFLLLGSAGAWLRASLSKVRRYYYHHDYYLV